MATQSSDVWVCIIGTYTYSIWTKSHHDSTYTYLIINDKITFYFLPHHFSSFFKPNFTFIWQIRDDLFLRQAFSFHSFNSFHIKLICSRTDDVGLYWAYKHSKYFYSVLRQNIDWHSFTHSRTKLNYIEKLFYFDERWNEMK